MSGMEKILTQDEYKSTLEGDIDLNKKIIKLGELSKLDFEDWILSINSSSFVGKVAFGLVNNAKSAEFSKETARLHGTGWYVSVLCIHCGQAFGNGLQKYW